MATLTLYLKPKIRNTPKPKVYKLLTRTIYFILLITVLSLTTSPAYSEEKVEQPLQEEQPEAVEIEVVEEQKPSEAAIAQTPIQTAEDKLRISQKNIIEIASSQIGTCGAEAIKKYTLGKSDAWCSEFVSWVYKESNIPFSGGSKNTPWILINSQQIEKWFRDNNHYHLSSSNYVPKRGDYVQTRNSDGSLHSAIIVGITQDLDSNQTVYVTIDGNWNNCVEQVEKHTRDNILGFGEIAILSF